MKTWQFVCTILTILVTVGTSSLVVTFNQGKLVQKVEYQIEKSEKNEKNVNKLSVAFNEFKLHFVEVTNELKLENLRRNDN